MLSLGRKGEDNYTCISAKGTSVVDFCNISEDDEFQVKTMSNCELLDGNDFAPLIEYQTTLS